MPLIMAKSGVKKKTTTTKKPPNIKQKEILIKLWCLYKMEYYIVILNTEARI